MRKRRRAAFVEIHTDIGLVGLGETYAGYFCPEVIPGVVDCFKPILIGQTVDDIGELWRRMYRCENFWGRVGLGPAVLSGIEAALWDLKGRAEGVPVHELLGGCKHARLPCYATGGPSNYPQEKLAAKIDFYLSLGFRGFKIASGCYSDERGWYGPTAPAEAADFEADKLQFVRAHVGPDIAIMLDGHMGNSPADTWKLETAVAVMKAVEPFNLFFFEEPLPYTDPWSYAELCRATEVPIAGGECLTAAYEWRVFTEQDAFDIGQPDASWTGGLGEFMNVAAMLEKRGRTVATHSWGAGGSLMQNLHCSFACANTVMLEVAPAFGPLHREIIGDDFVMERGQVLPPHRPGLGLRLTEAIKARYPFVPGSGEFVSVPGKILVD
ncbi:MAG: mandelate racemase/muconate lactonizing enzyme family protein [Opitutus sp.]|nr:mandelate racemase/muconate lactonizing enzyme family protein [Opitutus sp.]